MKNLSLAPGADEKVYFFQFENFSLGQFIDIDEAWPAIIS